MDGKSPTSNTTFTNVGLGNTYKQKENNEYIWQDR